MDAPRKPLSHAPTEQFTMKREEYKQMEDLRLVKHFAHWLSKVTGLNVTEETFEQDLMDGVVLCRLMSKINGSGMGYFHELKSNVPSLDAFKAKENLVSFQLAVKNLNLPISFGTEDLEKKNITRVISTLIFIAHVAHSQGVLIKEMDQEILNKVEQMDEALDQNNTSTELSWWQQLLIKFGLGDWINSLSLEAIKAYIATLKKNIEEKVESQKLLVKQQSETLQSKILEKTSSWKESLPDAIKTRIAAN